MWLALALILIGVVLLLLGLVVMPALGAPSNAHRNGTLAAAIAGGFLMLIGLLLALTSV